MGMATNAGALKTGTLTLQELRFEISEELAPVERDNY